MLIDVCFRPKADVQDVENLSDLTGRKLNSYFVSPYPGLGILLTVAVAFRLLATAIGINCPFLASLPTKNVLDTFFLTIMIPLLSDKVPPPKTILEQDDVRDVDLVFTCPGLGNTQLRHREVVEHHVVEI